MLNIVRIQFKTLTSLIKFLIPLFVFTSLYVTNAQASSENWSAITGEDKLQKFMSGLKAERELPSGELQSGEYQADGTGILRAWGASFPRTWQVKDDNQLCVTAERKITCMYLEKNTADLALYRVQDVTTKEYVEFTVVNKVADINEIPDPGSRGGPAAASAEEIAKELANPNTVLGTLNTNFDYKTFKGTMPGANDQDALVIGFQPSLPYPLAEGKNFFVRPLVPLIVNQPAPSITSSTGFEDAEYELGDIGFDAAYGQTFKNKSGANVFIAGFAGSIPTATSDQTGTDQWTLGPELGAFMLRKWGVAGIIASHQWDIAGDDSFDTNLTAGQYVYVISAGGGWQIIGSPTWSYNHEAKSEDALTLPVGIGIAKTLIISGRPWKLSLQYWNYVEAPDSFGPEHLIRFTVGPVVDLPWKGSK